MAAVIAGALGAIMGLIAFHAGTCMAESLRDWRASRQIERQKRHNGEKHG